MKAQITIDNDLCIQCGRCTEICPAQLFTATKQGIEVDPVGCLRCGQCVAACSTNAISHSNFHEGTVHSFDRTTDYPTADALMTLIKGRRSNRMFSNEPIPTDILDRIVEAAHYAPTATNSRDVREMVITDPAVIRQVTQFTIDTYTAMLTKIDRPIIRPLLRRFSPSNYAYIGTFHKMKAKYEAGYDPILRQATTVILYYTDSHSRFGCQDANLAYQNSSLMAEALGINHFYTGFVCVAASKGKGKLQQLLGIDGTIHAGMALALPTYQFNKYVDRE